MLATLLLAASMTFPDGNLLLGREAQGKGLSGAPAATDGLLAAEGSPAASAEAGGRAVRLADPNAHLFVDLGSPRPVGALLLQADAGDTYMVEASVDGRSWTGILRVEPGDAAYGMRTRKETWCQACSRVLLKMAGIALARKTLHPGRTTLRASAAIWGASLERAA